MTAAAGPNVRRTVAIRRMTVPMPATASGRRMLHGLSPKIRTDNPMSIGASDSRQAVGGDQGDGLERATRVRGHAFEQADRTGRDRNGKPEGRKTRGLVPKHGLSTGDPEGQAAVRRRVADRRYDESDRVGN